MAPRRRPRERGAAAVEFALVLPLLFLVIAGIVDFGRALYTEVILTNAAREGVRAAVMTNASKSEVEARANAAAIGLNLASFSATPTPSPTACPGGTGTATVNVVYKFDWIILGPALKLISAGGASLPTQLSAGAVMQCGG